MEILFGNDKALNLREGNTCIFVHFNPCESVYKYVLYYLQKIIAVDYKIIFVSNSKLSVEAVDELKDYCSVVCTRSNVGLDFMAWKEGLELIDYGTHNKEILLANDSVLGPIFDLNTIFKRMRSTAIDMWGMSDSYQIDYHIQSYFVCFTQKLLSSKKFRQFWRRVVPIKNKNKIIHKYEIGMTNFFLQKKFKCTAYFHIHNIVDIDKTGDNTNPLAEAWRRLITAHNYPFIKRDLFYKKELEHLNVIHEFHDIIEQVAPDFPLIIIYDYLHKIRKHSHKKISELEKRSCKYLQKKESYNILKKHYTVLVNANKELDKHLKNTSNEAENIRNILHEITKSRSWKIFSTLYRIFIFRR